MDKNKVLRKHKNLAADLGPVLWPCYLSPNSGADFKKTSRVFKNEQFSFTTKRSQIILYY